MSNKLKIATVAFLAGASTFSRRMAAIAALGGPPATKAPLRRPGRATAKRGNGHGRTLVRAGQKVGRNEPCPCGSGEKFKRCCADKPTRYESIRR